MPSFKSYTACYCYACDVDFLTPPIDGGDYHCPHCGDFMDVRVFKSLWMKKFIHHSRWTDTEDQILIQNKKAGVMHKDIAKLLDGRTELSVNSRVQALRKRGAIR